MTEEEDRIERFGGPSGPVAPIPTLPRCPNCGQEVLIPFSGYGGQMTTYFPKTYAHWVCIKCGFYMGTGNKSAKDLAKDLEVKIVEDIKKKISEVTRK
jgi:hypothetical protein